MPPELHRSAIMLMNVVAYTCIYLYIDSRECRELLVHGTTDTCSTIYDGTRQTCIAEHLIIKGRVLKKI